MVPVKMAPGMNLDFSLPGNAGPYVTGPNPRGLCRLAFLATAAVGRLLRQDAPECQRHTPGLQTCRPPLIRLQLRVSQRL